MTGKEGRPSQWKQLASRNAKRNAPQATQHLWNYVRLATS